MDHPYRMIIVKMWILFYRAVFPTEKGEIQKIDLDLLQIKAPRVGQVQIMARFGQHAVLQ